MPYLSKQIRLNVSRGGGVPSGWGESIDVYPLDLVQNLPSKCCKVSYRSRSECEALVYARI